MKDTASQTIEDLGKGVLRTYYHRGQVIVYTVSLLSEVVVDRLFEVMTTTLNDWPVGKPYRVMVVLAYGAVHLRYYAYRKTPVLAQMRPDVAGRVALVMANAEHVRYAATLIEQHAIGSRRKIKAFSHQTAALAWLKEGLGP